MTTISIRREKSDLRLLLAAYALFLIGCSSTSKMAKPLSDFSTASSDTTTVTTSALTIVQSADQDETVLKASKLSSIKEKDIPELFRPEDLLQRQLTLQALSSYATTLKTLSGVDRSADIQKSFDSLKTSIDSTVTTINKLNTGSQTPIPPGVVSGLVSLGSNLVIAYSVGEREKAIRTALEKSDNTVTKICNLLAAELDSHGVIYDQLKHAYQTQEESAIDNFEAISTPKKADGDPKPSATPKPSDLAPYAKALVGLRNKKENSLALLSSLAASYRKLAQAHTALKVQSQNGATADLQLRELSAQIDSVKFFYAQTTK